MRLLEKIHQIERIDNLIRRKATGSPKQLASRLDISERALYDCLDLMKSMNAPIYYCRSKGSYCYEEPVQFLFGFRKPDLDIRHVFGGKSQKEFQDFSLLRTFCTGQIYV